MTRPVLVTGGTGFLGSALVPRLVAAGDEVHVLARPAADRSPLAGLDLVWHAGDLSDLASIDRAVAAVAGRVERLGEGAGVVHAAALITYRAADAALAWRVNVEGTRRVLDACRARRIARLCHVSSVVAVGFTRDRSALLAEDAPFPGAALRCPYTATKRAAEDLVLAAAGDLDVVVVNPGAVFGPSRAPSNSQRFLVRLAAGRLGPLAPPGSLAVAGLADVAEGIVLALARGGRGRRYLLVESAPTHLELQRECARALGVRGPRGAVPRSLWPLAVAGAAALERVRPSLRLTPAALRHLGVHYRLSAARARAELGWHPETLPAVLRSTVESMRAAGILPS
ncbi:MAG: NAD-dependent epimerase/dehydratase family protein [Planctomycetota bacterium]